MSRREQPHSKKGMLASPAKRAIVAYLREHGSCTKETLQDALGHYQSWRVVATSDIRPRRNWLTKHLWTLQEQGHVERRIEGDRLVWAATTPTASATTSDPTPEPSAAPAGELVPSPSLDLMHRDTYRPATAVPVRAGGMDYARIPSLIGGQRMPYRSPR